MFDPRTHSSKPIAADLFDQAYIEQLTPVQQLRAERRTRRATISGLIVRFKRLSPGCKVNPIWMTVWTVRYDSPAEAEVAAHTWEERVEIKKPGFMGVGV